MGKYLNPNCSEILEQIKKPEFVDRSDLITELNNRIYGYGRYVAIYMPEDYGKTTAAKLLAAYYSNTADTGDIFFDLRVGKSDGFTEHLNKYNVILLDMHELYDMAISDNAENIISHIRQLVLDELKSSYQFLDKDEKSLNSALYDIYEKTGVKWVIIIDECDYLYRACNEDEELFREYYDFLISIFKGFHADNYTALGYLTGREHIKHYCSPLRAGIDHFIEYSMNGRDKMTKYFGIIQ